MKYRELGNTGMKVSEIALGTWQVGGGWGQQFSETVASEIIEAALENGINFLDTADVYDNQQSERMVGRYVKRFRDQLYIATKIGRRVSPHIAEAYTPEILETFVDEALVNTGLDYLDLVQLHCPPSEVYGKDEIYQKLEDIRKSGKVRHFGVSVETVNEAIQATENTIISTVQLIFNMFRLKPLDECFSVLSDRNVGIIVRVPLASGLLSGKLTPDRKFKKDDHRHFNRNGELFDKGETFSGVPLGAGFDAVDELRSLFGTDDLYQYALRWILMFQEVGTVIPGASRPDQIRSNVTSSHLPPLSKNQMDQVRRIYDQRVRQHVHHLW